MILLTMIHYTEQGIGIAEQERENHAFSTLEKAEDWLKQNGFSYRARTFLKGDPIEWCHEKEGSWDFIYVQINELEEDDISPFDFEPIKAPWVKAAIRDGFIEEMKNQGMSPEQIRAAYENHFGEKFMYSLD